MDLNKSIRRNYTPTVKSAFILRVSSHPESLRLSMRCAQSCEKVEMPYEFFEGVDGTSGSLVVPESLRLASSLSWLKIMDHELSVTEVACVLSHFALWVKCIELDEPIVVLEHDAIMVKKFIDFPGYNQIVYLGNVEQKDRGWPVLSVPPHATVNHNYHFICRAHAYAIDPAIAKNLVSHLIKNGIQESLDIMLRADLFNITQVGLFAYDEIGQTTIVSRKKKSDGTER
jgi:GR25 family glycosyltransferase involved in LPS biosynthesis